MNVCGNCRGNGRGWPWKLPRQFLRISGGCHGRYDGVCHGKNRGYVPWTQPWHLPRRCHNPWHLPRKPADFHGSPCQHPRKSTEVPRYQCRGSPPKSQIMRILDFMLHNTTAWLCNVASITRAAWLRLPCDEGRTSAGMIKVAYDKTLSHLRCGQGCLEREKLLR